eukprot:comp78298_c0_seq1/m.48313 comp78298_c0_seq1/g.48313  ORF comp78298_c0_seq1/g.48313 comp78298_c0_seq1/m.48313 type:complete len:222 (-) comp78298_c0_seq1:90-755(-)
MILTQIPHLVSAPLHHAMKSPLQLVFIRSMSILPPNLPPPAPAPDKLDGVVHVDLLKKLSPERIRDIWLEHHMKKDDAFSDIMTDEQYARVLHRGYECPMFVMPVAKKGGSAYYTLVAQFQAKHILFTFLDEFRRNPRSQPWFTVTMFDEFAKDEKKKMVLVRGLVTQTNRINKGEADTTWRVLRKIYANDADYNSLVVPFNKRPNEFQFERLLHRVGIRN